MKKVTWFFPFHQVHFMDKIMKNKKGLGLATCILELQNMFKKIYFLHWPIESGNWKEKEKKQNTEYLENEKCLLEEITSFLNF